VLLLLQPSPATAAAATMPLTARTVPAAAAAARPAAGCHQSPPLGALATLPSSPVLWDASVVAGAQSQGQRVKIAAITTTAIA